MAIYDYLSVISSSLFYICIFYTALIFITFIITKIFKVKKLDSTILKMSIVLVIFWIITVAMYIMAIFIIPVGAA